jgi:hypothetical protein
MNNANIWITEEGITYDFFKITYPQDINTREKHDIVEETYKMDGQVVSMRFVGSDKDASFAGIEKLTTYHNYFFGNDKTKWATNVPLYKEIEVKEIYSGIDQRFYYDDNYVRYDIIVKPGADPGKISMEFTGADAISIANNELIISTKFGDLKNSKLYVYQEISDKNEKIECKFIKDEIGNIGFTIGNYDKNAELIIDPLIYSTFLGGSEYDLVTSIKADKDGNSYIAGLIMSTDFPTFNQYQDYMGAPRSSFITKLSPDGSSVIFSTYFGGSDFSGIYGLALDEKNNIYVGGIINRSTSFPQYNPLPPPYGYKDSDSYSGFVSVFNSEGNNLLYSTTIGSRDYISGIAVDKNNDIYICGGTNTGGLETMGSGYNVHSGSSFVAKLVKNGDSYKIGYYTYVYPDDYFLFNRMGNNIVIDNDGNAYAAVGIFPKIAFCKVNDATGLVYVKDDILEKEKNIFVETHAIGINNNNEIYLTGWIGSSQELPITENAFRTTYSGGVRDGFITKFSNDGTLLLSTYFGETSEGRCVACFHYVQSVCFDRFGRTVIKGHSERVGIGPEMFVTRFKLGDKEISYSESIRGGSNAYGVPAPICTQDGYIYVTTNTSPYFPTTPDAYQTKPKGYGEEMVVLKFDATSYFDVKGQIFQYNNALEDVTVTLIGSDGSVITTTTDKDGNYSFSKVKEDYYIASCKIGNNTYENSFVLLDEDKTIDFDIIDVVVDINEPKDIPITYSLSQNYPNPFNPTTTIQYSIPKDEFVKLTVYDVTGKVVKELVSGHKTAGKYSVEFNASSYSSGTYYYKIEAGEYKDIQKMMLVK